MHFLVLQPFESHVPACSEDVGAVVFEDFLQMMKTIQTHFVAAFDEFESEVESVDWGMWMFVLFFRQPLGHPCYGLFEFLSFFLGTE